MAYTNTVWDAASREYNAEIVVYNSSGTAQEDSFVNEIESFSLKRSMADSSSIAMASATASSLSLRLKNVTLAKLNTLRNNAYFRLKITCNANNSGLTSGLGFYFIDKLEHKRRTNGNYDVSLNCYDLFFKTEKTYTPSSSISSATTVTARMIVADIISQVTGRAYNISLADSTWATTTITDFPQDTSMRVVLSYMAGLNGKCVVTKEDGNFPSFTAIWYTDSEKFISATEQYQDGYILRAESDVKVTSLTSGTDENPITKPDNSGVGLNLSFANPYMTESLLSTIATNRGITSSTTAIQFQPMSLKWRGNALLDIGSTLSVGNPNVYYFTCDTESSTATKNCIAVGNAPSSYPHGSVIAIRFAHKSKYTSSSSTVIKLVLKSSGGTTLATAHNAQAGGGNMTLSSDTWQDGELTVFRASGGMASTGSTWNFQTDKSMGFGNCYVMEKTINYDGGYYEEISCLGDTTQSVSFKTNPLGKINRKMNAMEAAILEATQIIGDVEDMQSGVFTIIKDSQGTNNIGWKIESNLDNNYILANKNGIGFSSNGGQSFNAAAIYIDPRDGKGHLNANNIVVENLNASAIVVGSTTPQGLDSVLSSLDTSVSDVSKRTDLYFTCSTSSSTATKVAVLQDSGTIPTITYGTRIVVKFSNQSKISDTSTSTLKLKLTDSGGNELLAEKAIDAGNGKGRAWGQSNCWSANSIVSFVYTQITYSGTLTDVWVIQADYNAQQSASTAQTTANTANANALAAQSTADGALARATYLYATCSTAAGTTTKVATISPTADNFELFQGCTVTVYFTYENTASSPTLNINNTGAKAIYAEGAALASRYYWSAKSTHTFTYSGTYWLLTDNLTQDNLQALADYCATNNIVLVKEGVIAAGAITSGKIQAGAVKADAIAANAITADKIAAGAITAEKINLGWQSGNLASSSKWANPGYTDSDYLKFTVDDYGNLKCYVAQDFTSSGKSLYSAPFYIAAGAKVRMSATFNLSGGSSKFVDIALQYSSTINGTYSDVSASSYISSSNPSREVTLTNSGYYRLALEAGYLNTSSTVTNIYVTYTITGNMVVTGQIKSSNGNAIFDLDNARILSKSSSYSTELSSGGLVQYRGSSYDIEMGGLIPVLSTQNYEALFYNNGGASAITIGYIDGGYYYRIAEFKQGNATLGYGGQMTIESDTFCGIVNKRVGTYGTYFSKCGVGTTTSSSIADGRTVSIALEDSANSNMARLDVGKSVGGGGVMVRGQEGSTTSPWLQFSSSDLYYDGYKIASGSNFSAFMQDRVSHLKVNVGGNTYTVYWS